MTEQVTLQKILETHVDFMDCPSCLKNIYANAEIGDEVQCPYCKASFYISQKLKRKYVANPIPSGVV